MNDIPAPPKPENEPDTLPLRLVIQIPLPCGCVMEQQCTAQGVLEQHEEALTPTALMEFMGQASAALLEGYKQFKAEHEAHIAKRRAERAAQPPNKPN